MKAIRKLALTSVLALTAIWMAGDTRVAAAPCQEMIQRYFTASDCNAGSEVGQQNYYCTGSEWVYGTEGPYRQTDYDGYCCGCVECTAYQGSCDPNPI